MSLINVNQNTCNKDGICAAVCPGNFIRFAKGEFPVPIDEIDTLCIRCGHCVAACPSASLQHAEIPLEECPEIQEDLLLSADQSEQFLRSRRSIRNYQNKVVPREQVQKLIEIARCAPSGHNTQTTEWLVLIDRKELNRLVGIVGEWMRWMLLNMSEFALSIYLDSALKRLEGGEDVVLRGAPTLIVAHAAKTDMMAPQTCTIALAYLELAATSLGLGGCWAGYFNAAMNSFPPMKKALGLPEGHQSYGAMMLGFPKFRYHRLPLRKKPSISWR